MDPAPAPPARTPQHRFVLLAAAAAPLGLLAAALLLEPDARGFGTHEQLGLPPCTPMRLWGVPCPGCGVTTSVALAARGRLGDALAAQPFGLLLVLAALAFSAWAAAGALRGRDLWLALRGRPLARVGVALGAALAAAWVYKLATV